MQRFTKKLVEFLPQDDGTPTTFPRLVEQTYKHLVSLSSVSKITFLNQNILGLSVNILLMLPEIEKDWLQKVPL